MAVVIDATVGGENSNSYVTLAESETYFEARPYTDEWLALTDDEKSQFLIYSTTLLDNMLIPYGTIASDTQALDFPRSDITDCNGREIEEDEIPQDIKNAQMEQAIYLSTNNVTQSPDLLTKGFKKARVGDLSIEADKLYTADTLSSQTIGFLRCYGVLAPGATSNGFNISQTYRN